MRHSKIRIAIGSYACAVLLALGLVLPAHAADVVGRITVGANGVEILPEGVTSAPLPEVEVHVGVIERLGGTDAFYSHIASGFTDDDGNYSIFIGEDPDPSIPNIQVDHVVVVILESEDKGVAVYDNENDPTAPACLGTQLIPVGIRGETRIDIDLAVGFSNDTSYNARAMDFDPIEDKAATPPIGEVRCVRELLGMSVMPTPLYDQRGITNTKPDRFGHLAIHYARAFDAYRFVRDGLGKAGFTPVRVNSWDDTTVLSYSYLCSENAIQMPPERSQIIASDLDSRIYAMRHEYGHHFMCASSIAGDGELPPRGAGNSAHGGLANSNSAAAWTEGFATWFAAAVSDYNEENRPEVQLTKAGEIDLLFGDAQLDDPFTAGEQPTHGALGEEFAIATLLWQITDTTGTVPIFDSLEGAAVDLDDFNRVYTTLMSDFSISSPFDTLPCDFIDTGAFLFGIDCLFIDRGFYHDLDGDGRYGPDEEAGGNEIVGSTRWPLDMLDENTFRPDTPAIDGSTLLLTVEDDQGQPVDVTAFDVEIQYDPPFEMANSDYRRTIVDSGPYEVPLLLPAKPSRALITPVTDSEATAPPLVIESAFFHDAVNPFRQGGVAAFLAEHTFVVPEPGAVAASLAAVAALALLRRRARRCEGVRCRSAGPVH